VKKVFLLVFMVLCPSLLFASDNVTIKTQISVSRQVLPDTYLLPVSISVKLKKESQVLNLLGKVDKEVRKLGMDYSGGSYSVYKVTRWDPEKKKSVFEGFRGNLSYQFRLKEPSVQDKIFSLLTKLKKRHPAIEISVSNPSWIVSKKRAILVKDSLYIRLLKRATVLSKRFGRAIGKRCSLKEVNFTPHFYSPIRYKSALRSESVSAPIPKKSEQEISLDANVVYLCR